MDEVGLINVNDVGVAPNLHTATVFIGVLGGEAQKKRAMEALEQNRKRIQGLLGQAVVLKYTPQLRFVLDDSVERGNRVLRILDELEKSSALLMKSASQDHSIASWQSSANSQSICVAGHVRPDGDCIGSQLGLTLALRKAGQGGRLLERETSCRKNTPSWTRTTCCEKPARAA